jgi:tRNA dimethylallyltransferase
MKKEGMEPDTQPLEEHLASLIVVAGPTASGKSDLALHLAAAFQGEIVNCDSLQLYRGFDIGTAKTPPSARRGIRHHLLDILEASDVTTAGEYARRARAALKEITARGSVPIVVGGTGFYMRALLEGLAAGPVRDVALRNRLARMETGKAGRLHRLLVRLDAETARRIHQHDINKLIRAVEICLLSRRPAVQVFDAGRDALRGYRPLKLVLSPDRKALRERIALRTGQMFAAGLVEEVGNLIAQGAPPDAKPLEAIGYREAMAVVQGRMTIAEAEFATSLATGQYAKRQLTWFRKEAGVTWVPGFGDDPQVQQDVTVITRRFLACLHA